MATKMQAQKGELNSEAGKRRRILTAKNSKSAQKRAGESGGQVISWVGAGTPSGLKATLDFSRRRPPEDCDWRAAFRDAEARHRNTSPRKNDLCLFEIQPCGFPPH